MTTYYDHETMLNNILDWASTKSEFDDSTFRGIKDYYEERGQFTSRQGDAIENVYYKWKIDKKYGSCEYSTKKPKKRRNNSYDDSYSQLRGCSECAPYGGNGTVYAFDDCYIPCPGCCSGAYSD